MPAFSEIAPAQLARLVGTPEAPALIDVRSRDHLAEDARMLPASIGFDAATVAEWGPAFRGRDVVVICQRGAKLAHGAAAWLRTEGVRAETLEGGFAAWRDAGLPLIDVAKLPRRGADGRTTWVTRARPKIDRIACPWLIRRFFDPAARFLFVAPSEVTAVAERFGGAPFDVEGVPFSHRGTQCTFDALLEDTGLATEPLARLATIVRGADTDDHGLAPQCAGLLAVSLGLSRMHREDLAQLEAGMTVYDALFRWCRDATEERHDWPSASVRPGASA